MQKIKMSRGTLLTFEEGCNKYLENCRQRNLREGTINHYRQSYLYFYLSIDNRLNETVDFIFCTVQAILNDSYAKRCGTL